MSLLRNFAVLAIALTATINTARAETYPAGTADNLRLMIEIEKMAGDVYEVFGGLYPNVTPFQATLMSEDDHFNALVGQANSIGIEIGDITSLSAGHYQSTKLQSLYGNLLARGQSSSYAALTVGRDLETNDIHNLTVAMAGIPSSSSLYQTYDYLLNGSYHHLNAFNNWLAITPAPPVPEPETYAMLLAGLGLIGSIARRRKTLAV